MTHQNTLLIVDDSTENLKLLGNSLKNAGFNILAALNGKQALALAASKLPDLILLDVMMPEMNGFEVCNALKENTLTYKIPVIFLTASIEPESVKTGFDAGGVDYIAKPFNPDELILRVNNHLKQKIEKDNLERELKYKSSLLKNISEGIMSPLSVVLNNANELSAGPSPEDFKKHLKQIQSSVTTIKKFTHNLADLAEMENYPYKEIQETFNLCSVLNSLGIDPQTSQKYKQPELNIHVNASIDGEYRGDKKRLFRGLLQMVNVVKQTKKESINISAWLKHKEENADVICIDFSGVNTGKGELYIDNNYFYDRDIGLLMVRELLRFVNCKIRYSTTFHVNSVFSIELSLSKAIQTNTESIEKEHKRSFKQRVLNKKNILIVEDNELNQRLMESVLQSYGAQTTLAHTGKEAIEKALEHTYDLILMDINVPLMNGIEVTTVLRNHYNLSTPIIAISGHSDKASIKKCLDSGMNTFLLKPFEIAELESVILIELKKQNTPIKSDSITHSASLNDSSPEVVKYSLDKIYELSNGDKELIEDWTNKFRTIVSKGRLEVDKLIASKNLESESRIFHELNNYTSYFGVDLLREYLKDIPKLKNSGTSEEVTEHLLNIAEELKSIDIYFNELKKTGNKK